MDGLAPYPSIACLRAIRCALSGLSISGLANQMEGSSTEGRGWIVKQLPIQMHSGKKHPSTDEQMENIPFR